MDAFSRILAAAGIRTASSPARGVWASMWGEFATNTTYPSGLRAMVPEFVSREWRKVQYGVPSPQQRSLYTEGEGIVGSWERPYADAMNGRWSKMLQPQIPLAWLIALTTPITGREYRTYYLQSDATNERFKRVLESTNIPTLKLVGAERVVNLHKYGGGIEATYETLRYQRIDKIALHIQQLAARAEAEKVSQILDIMVSGDGNSGTGAIAHTQTGLHSGSTAGTLTLTAYLNYLMQFESPYRATGIIGRNADVLKVMLLSTGSANIPLAFLAATFGSVRPVNQDMANLPIAWHSDAPASTLVAFDGNYAVERVVEIGSTITEVEKYVKQQVEGIYMTETEGYAKMDVNAVRTLDISS